MEGCYSLTDDPIEPEGQIVGDDPAHVGPERVAHTRQPVGAQARAPERAQGLRSATGHGPEIVDRGHVAGRLAERPPVQHEHVVATAAQVCCGKYWTVVLFLLWFVTDSLFGDYEDGMIF